MVHYTLGSWYRPDEINRRGGLYYCGLNLGSLTSGLLQGQIFETLNGRFGLPGWRWMFIIDRLITLPVAIIALYLIPGSPYNCHSLFLTDEEILLARKRLKDANVHPPSRNPQPFFNKNVWKKVLTSWQIYGLMIFDCLFWNSTGAFKSSGFAFWVEIIEKI